MMQARRQRLIVGTAKSLMAERYQSQMLAHKVTVLLAHKAEVVLAEGTVVEVVDTAAETTAVDTLKTATNSALRKHPAYAGCFLLYFVF
jgi:uncharacterized membrane protein